MLIISGSVVEFSTRNFCWALNKECHWWTLMQRHNRATVQEINELMKYFMSRWIQPEKRHRTNENACWVFNNNHSASQLLTVRAFLLWYYKTVDEGSIVTLLEKWRVSNINFTWLTRGVMLTMHESRVMHYEWWVHGQHYTLSHERVIYVTHEPFFKEWHFCLFEEWTKHFLESQAYDFLH